jgi:hypothetical protein
LGFLFGLTLLHNSVFIPCSWKTFATLLRQ